MFLYEMHQHSDACSACGHMSPADAVRELKEAGFAGMVLTDHFYHGNSRIDRSRGWEFFVQAYAAGWQAARSAAEGLDFDVLFGLEEDVGERREVLVYGLTPEKLLAHPEWAEGEVWQGDVTRIAPIVRAEGGVVIQAHPFRGNGRGLPFQPLPLEYLDGMEIANACNAAGDNDLAVAYAREHGVTRVTAGSDAHYPGQAARWGIACERRIRDAATLAQVLRAQEYEIYVK